MDEYRIKWNEGIKMFVAYEGVNPIMKNKSESTLYIKLGKWLQSQGR